MEKIIRIHEKVFNYLLKKRKTNPNLFFMPRRINNKERLKKGYWFLGNEEYLHLSFWDGEDWKEKIHNIGFVIFNNKKSSIGLSAQDSENKALFLKKVADKLGGFEKNKSKNKWHKEYSDYNYLKNLENFINNEKVLIDELLKSENPEGIKRIDNKDFLFLLDKINQIRKEQIDHGDTHKIVRICWNTNDWKYPSGANGKSNSKESYENQFGYGHEEWLFDKSKILEGYHYAFLEPLNVKSGKHEGKKYDISLITINNLDKKYFVANIKNVECITRIKSREIYKIYKANGWLKEMQRQIEIVGGLWKNFFSLEPDKFFNIRFKFEDVTKSLELEEISDDDINITTSRFKLLPKKNDFLFELENFDDDLDEGNKKNTEIRKKTYNSETVNIDPYHDKMQNAIKDLLDNDEKYKIVKIEKDRVDLKAKTIEGDWHFFEVKTDNPKHSIRKAIGQIMEYAYYPDIIKASKLIIISDQIPDEKTIKYLNFIREKFKIPITYRCFNLETKKISEDF